ncbi:MAG TPA: hypothetical protein VGG96_01595 [Steroidobacteraceae bacterium]|jgi:hypothetical protein
MNEIEIIRSQIAAEQSHAAEVANACAAVFGSESAARAGSSEATALFREACVSYLVWVLARFEERDQTLSELLAARQRLASGPTAASVRHLASLIARSGTSREALSRLEAALAAGEAPAARAGWQEFTRFFDSAWAPRRATLDGALAEHLRVADLRAVYAIDADSILDERKRYARVAAQAPAGTGLRPTGPAEPRA